MNRQTQPSTRPAAASSRRLLGLRFMLAGFVLSFLGSALVAGASTGLVAAGALPVGWLAVLATLEMGLDLTSPLAMRAVERFDPGKLLAALEAVDSVACLVCLVALLGFGADAALVLVAYLVAMSVLPLVIDLAEELYVSKAARGDSLAALRFNAAAFSITAAAAFLIARPLGALASSTGLSVLLAANLVLSVAALAARWRAVRLAPTVAPADERSPSATRPAGRPARVRLRRWVGDTVRLGPLSPLVSGGLSFAAATSTAYLPLWISKVGGSRSVTLAAAMAGLGLGRVAGPQIGARLGRREGLRSGLITMTAVLAVVFGALSLAGVVVTGPAGHSVIGALVVLMVALGAAVGAALTILITLRQTELSGRALSSTVAQAHALAAGASIAGAWTGVVLGVARGPVAGAGVSAAVTAGVATWLVHHRSRRPMLAAEPAV